MDGTRSLLREYLEVLLITLIFAVFARTYAVQAFKIPTGSMKENLLIGDHILVNKFIYGRSSSALESMLLPNRPVRRGDVVVFKFPEDPSRDFIKRCVGLPGDEIEIVDKNLFVNGQKVEDHDYTFRLDPRNYPRSVFLDDSYRHRDNFGPETVPDGHYFFLGDNRDNSNDSRFWGAVPAEFIKGRAFLIYWSFEDGRESVDWPGYQGRAKQLAHVFLRFFANTRWERSFNIVK